jgi:hypothetical protein
MTDIKEKFKMLNDEQSEVVRQKIIESMIDASIEAQLPVSDDFVVLSKRIADKIVRNVQMALVQGATFTKVVKEDKPKVKKPVTKKLFPKKVLKKIKKNVRK